MEFLSTQPLLFYTFKVFKNPTLCIMFLKYELLVLKSTDTSLRARRDVRSAQAGKREKLIHRKREVGQSCFIVFLLYTCTDVGVMLQGVWILDVF